MYFLGFRVRVSALTESFFKKVMIHEARPS